MTDQTANRRHECSAVPFRVIDDKSAMKVGLLLAGVALVLIVIHIITYSMMFLQGHGEDGFAGVIHSFVNLGGDNSVSENLNHGMLFICFTSFLYVFHKTRSRLSLFLFSFFAFAWFDDSCQYHERLGIILAHAFELPALFGLREKDLGELLAWVLAAAILASLGVWAYRCRRSGDGIVLRSIAYPIAILIFCAVVFDIAHIMIEGPMADVVFTALEDGGEMMAIAAAATVSLAILGNYGKIYQRG